MINTLESSMNLFLAMWSALPAPITAFVKWTLGVALIVGIYYVVKEWIK